MPYITFNPSWQPGMISRNINRIMNNIMRQPYRAVDTESGFKPAVDIAEDEKAYYFDIELPGIEKENVKITVDDDKVLTIKGEKKVDYPENVDVCCRNERRSGNFSRSFQLTEDADPEKIEAKYEHGLLKLKVSKSEPSKPKQQVITIN